MNHDNLNVSKLVLIPGLVTLAVTLLRLVGELNNWSPALFNRAAGGGGALVGISWLALVFAVYFAVRLRNDGLVLDRPGASIAYAIGALAVMIGGGFVFFFGVHTKSTLWIWVGLLIAAASLVVMRRTWPAYWNVMMCYALWARVPVIIVMFLAIRGNWGTHYDVAPPSGDIWGADWLRKWFDIGVVPQLFIWIPYTVVFCGLIGVIVAVALKRKSPAPASA